MTAAQSTFIQSDFLSRSASHTPELLFKSVGRPESFFFSHFSFPHLATVAVTFHFLFLLGAVVNGDVTAYFGNFSGNRLFGGFLP